MQVAEFIVVLSGKRKSGKDFVADLLQKRFGCDRCQILRLSGPLKQQYAQENGLKFEELLTSNGYKELHRAKMIQWGEEKRQADPYFFCNKTIEAAEPGKTIWIVSDARRKTDVQFFREKYPNVSRFVRITASLDIRQTRGFVFTPGVDDAESECGLDEGVTWDFTLSNDGDSELLEQCIQTIMLECERIISTKEDPS